MNTTTRDDVKQLAATIEVLAREVQSKLDANGDFLSTAHELVRNNVTFVFTLGEVYALEQKGHFGGVGKTVKATQVSNANYHNLRDNRGRFAKKI
jgi:hypothetical protein